MSLVVVVVVDVVVNLCERGELEVEDVVLERDEERRSTTCYC